MKKIQNLLFIFTLIQQTIVISLLLIPNITEAKTGLEQLSQLSKSGFLLEDENGHPLRSHRENNAYIPASTTKLVTAWLALSRWEEGHRFKTDFYWEPQTKTLSVKGSGDPFLVSEEIQRIAHQLKSKGIQKVNTIVLDDSLFQHNLIMPGTGRTNNPYDAVPSALAANFNTIYVKKVRGVIMTAESQTPLTNTSRQMKNRFRKGKLRANTGRNPSKGVVYFGELLNAFLQRERANIRIGIISQRVPFYSHYNSKTLGEMIKPMLKHSTNFIANQLVLMLSQKDSGLPANSRDVSIYMNKELLRAFPHWRNFSLKDGAGLSRGNRLSPKQLVELLFKFKRWKHLLPKVAENVYAKSGTLNKVSTLAGYVNNHGRYEPFALMLNQNAPYRLRNKIARELGRGQY